MLYRYETHVHCAKGSACAKSSAEEMVRAYHAAGFAGLVLTDHFIFGNTAVDRKLPWKERMIAYWKAYLEGQAAAEELDFDLIFGLEHGYGGGKEFLFYGIDLEFLLANPEIPELPLEELTARVREYGGLVIQAHPYRSRVYINDTASIHPELADGIEVHNAYNAEGEDKKALALAQAGGHIMTCGGDIHLATSDRLGSAGITLPYRVRTGKELVAALRRGDHGYIVHGKEMATISPEELP